jgi:MarR family transcriptional regulator, negative regulator of the multidrug operon emrRAB
MDRLANLLGVTAVAATDRLRRAVESELAHGGSVPAALVHLQAYPGESLEALRHVLGVSQPAAVRVVNRLVTEGLLERRAGPDRRTVALHLTAAGDRAASDLLARRARSLRALLDVLPPDEQAALEPLLERLAAALADDRSQALRVCRLCDRRACTSAPGCPLDHTSETDR